MTIAAGVLALAGCTEDLDSLSGSAAPYSRINFSMTSNSPNTRTQYASNDWLQIEWIKGDKITIACDQTQAPISNDAANLDESNWAKKTSAIYEVSQVIADQHNVELSNNTTQQISTNSKARIKPSSTDAKDALYWGGNKVDYVFYAAYGESVTINETTGVAKCVYQPDQFLTENTRNEWINMEQAYMVATKTTKPVDNVDLHFKPIMTTLAVEVQAPAGGLTLKAMEIDLPASLDVIYTNNTTNSAYFDYDIANGTVKTNNVGTQTAEKLVFNLKTPKTLAASEKTTLVALLPPVAISNGDPITITIDANEGYSITTVTTLAVPAGNKAVISASADWKKKDTPVDYVEINGVKWAKCNLGANNEWESGDYYGWGCIVPYSTSSYIGDQDDPNSDWSVYFKKIGGTGGKQADCGAGTVKDPLSRYMYPDSGRIQNTDYDAAHVRLGGKWRMPTKTEMESLIACTWGQIVENNGVEGVYVYKEDPNKKIFLPFAGWRTKGETYVGKNIGAHYWSGILDPLNNSKAYDLTMDISGTNVVRSSENSFCRYLGFHIRPVYGHSYVVLAGHKWAMENVITTGSIPIIARHAIYGDFFTMDPNYVGYVYDAVDSWGDGNWAVPTTQQWEDLISKCDWEWKNGYYFNGKTCNGYLVKGKAGTSEAGNSIFLPATGMFRNGNFYNQGKLGYYWSSSETKYLYFTNENKVMYVYDLWPWMQIRPVLKE